MLTPSEFQQWCRELQLPPSTCDLITGIRTASSACHATSRANNVSGAYPSRKMGVTIQFENRTVELWAIYLMFRRHGPLLYSSHPKRNLETLVSGM